MSSRCTNILKTMRGKADRIAKLQSILAKHIMIFDIVSLVFNVLFTLCVCVCAEASVWKKKRVCVRVVPVGSVDTAVLDIKVTAKSKMMLQHYTYVGLVTFPKHLTCSCVLFKAILKFHNRWSAFSGLTCHFMCRFLQRRPRLRVVVQKGTLLHPHASSKAPQRQPGHPQTLIGAAGRSPAPSTQVLI